MSAEYPKMRPSLLLDGGTPAVPTTPVAQEAAPKVPKTKMTPIGEVSRSELARYAQIAGGIEVGDRDTPAVILTKMAQAGLKPTHIPKLPVGPPPRANMTHTQPGDVPATSIFIHPTKKDRHGKERKFCRILLHLDPRPGGDRPVPVGVNGNVMFIPRGKDCDVPLEHGQALLHAIEYHYEQNPDIEGGLMDPIHVSAYPVSFVPII